MTEEEKALIWTIGTVEHLIDDGIMEGPKMMTAKGWLIYEQLIEEDYQPTDEQMGRSMDTVMAYQREEYEKAVIESN